MIQKVKKMSDPLTDKFRDPNLINKKAIEDNLDLIEDIFKGTIYEIKE
mgnify:FL=1